MLHLPLSLMAVAILVLSACNERRQPSDGDTGSSQAVDKGDAYYLPQESDGYQGRGPVSARWLGERSGGLTEFEREPKRIEVADAGDMAYEIGT